MSTETYEVDSASLYSIIHHGKPNSVIVMRVAVYDGPTVTLMAEAESDNFIEHMRTRGLEEEFETELVMLAKSLPAGKPFFCHLDNSMLRHMVCSLAGRTYVVHWVTNTTHATYYDSFFFAKRVLDELMA